MQYPLLPFSQIVFQDIKEGRGDIWNFHFELKARGINADRLREAIRQVVAHHPVFHMRITDDGMQEYDAQYLTPFFSYDITASPSINNKEGEVTLHLHFHRILGDGASMLLFLTNVNKAYKGEVLPADTYLEYLEQQETLKHSARYANDKEWLERRYDGITAPTSLPLDPDNTDWDDVPPYEATLRIMDANNTDEAAITWSYIGRETAKEMHIFGSLHRDIPFLAHRGMSQQEVQEEIEQGIIHSSYPYTFNARDRQRWKTAVNVQKLPPMDLSIGNTQWRASDAEEEPLPEYPRFIEKFEENVRLYPDKVILQDSETTLTFRDLDELSGRVYAYLKQNGIGKEDTVIVNIPRSVNIFVACLGIWKAGAALVCIEYGTPQNRIDYIAADSHCKIIIGAEEIASMLAWEGIEGHEDTNLHDAALYYYTSGSEGNPKGILHEYGKLDLIASTLAVGHEKMFKSTDIYGLWFPVSTPILGMILVAISERCIVNILPATIIRNPQAIAAYIAEHNITIIGIVPSYLNGVKIEMPTLRQLQVASEIAHNIYYDDIELVNVYGQSEGGISAFTFMIDKKYDNTPIGLPTQSIHECLLDDDDSPVAEGSMGELCYENPYTRGYINSPELNQTVFRNGLFHTGDIARIDENGNYVILGRKTDMIKINGNRIEPAEIEAAVKRVLGIEWAFAKGFVTGERSFICVYYTADIDIDYAKVREQLLLSLPTYMIPSYFVHIDDIPRLPNGKIDRQAFKAPDIEEYRADFVAPSNEVETTLCETMQRVLGVERISVNDDFYLLGGDSLRTIQLVSECGIDDLNTTDIYAARTAAKIAQRWLQRRQS